jgi:putative transposase
VQRLCIVQRRIAWTKQRTLYSGKPPERRPSWASQGREATELRAEYSYLADVPADTMSAVVKRVDEAYSRMFKDWKSGKRSKVRWADSADHVGLVFRGNERGTQVLRATERHAWWVLAGARKLGALKVRMHRPIPAGSVIKQAHITQAADGWYISFSCEIPDLTPAPSTGTVIGVDLNVKHEGDEQQIAAVNDGRVYRTPAGLKRNAKRMATLQKLVSKGRRTKGSAKSADPKSRRTEKRRERIARLHQRIARQREHAQQYAARRLVDTADVIVFEQLNHTGMRRKGKGRRKRGLNRALSTAAPGRLIALTREKAQAAGRRVETVSARNTSRACSACGALSGPQGMVGLSVRSWTCAECGARHDRDVNAAQNIRARYLGNTPACSGGVPGEGADLRVERPSVNLEADNTADLEVPDRLPTGRKKRTTRKLGASHGNNRVAQLALDFEAE